MPEKEYRIILAFCHELHCDGHFGGKKTTLTVLQSRFYWPTLFKDAHMFCTNYDRCLRICNIGKNDEIHLTSNLVVKLFDV